jgi:sterol desaturase/sphingolipid hydroxylase (fatty acid hydroxylase superfamily)
MLDLAQISSVLAGVLLNDGACRVYVALTAFFAAMVLLDLRAGRSLKRYLSAGFATDIVYALMIVGGIYGLAQQPVVSWLDSRLRLNASFLYLDLMRGLPEPVQLLAFLLAVDFCRYWKHRCLHAVPVLWVFHSIHHGPRQLTFLTNYRLHLVEVVLDGVVTLAPVVLLGTPPHLWLPVASLLLWYTSLHHCDLDWGYGWLDHVLVSPRYHSRHHSGDPADHGSNFAAAFSVWDSLFGTARRADGRPARYGLPDLAVPEGIARQFFFPFRQIIRGAVRELSAEPERQER